VTVHSRFCREISQDLRRLPTAQCTGVSGSPGRAKVTAIAVSRSRRRNHARQRPARCLLWAASLADERRH